MNGTQNLNLDSQTLEQCLKTTSKFGETVYTNICTGQSYAIPMGGLDWLLVIGTLLLGVTFILVLLAMLKSLFDY